MELSMTTVNLVRMAVALALTALTAEPLFAQRLIDHDRLTSVAFSPDGNTFASLGVDGIKFWTLRGKLIGTLKTKHGKLAFSPDGKLLAVGHEDRVALWSINSSPMESKEILSIKVDGDNDG